MKCNKCNNKMRELVDFDKEDIYYCIEGDKLDRPTRTPVKR